MNLNTRLRQATSWGLVCVFVFQPLEPLWAGGITPTDTRTTIMPHGDVPVIDIAAPNGSGISHNRFKEFNVGEQGAVLNNATSAGQSALAGELGANPRFNGEAAQLIINEVTGRSRSELNGQLEVFGDQANLMIANPRGITCNGCGFVNAPGVTLTTGKPTLDKQGALNALSVLGGTITIGERGMDAGAQDYVELISRTADLQGRLEAQQLNVTLGTNQIDYQQGTTTPIAQEGNKPALAIDTKALGGMYANRIRLIASEEGVGVNLGTVQSRTGEITLDANGTLRVAQTRAQTDLNVRAAQLVVAREGSIGANRDITLVTPELDNQGRIVAKRDMRVLAERVDNHGDRALLQARQNLWIQGDAQGEKSAEILNRSGTIKTEKGDLVIRGEVVENEAKEKDNSRYEDVIDSRGMSSYTIQEEGLAEYQIDAIPDNLKASFEGATHFVTYRGDQFWEPDRTDDWMDPDGPPPLLASTYVLEKNERILDHVPKKRAMIASGRHLYINADQLINDASSVTAKKDIYLAGKKFSNITRTEGQIGTFGSYAPVEGPAYRHEGVVEVWNPLVLYPAEIIAKGKLVADFQDAINIETPIPANAERLREIVSEVDDPFSRGTQWEEEYRSPTSLSAAQIVLNSDNIKLTSTLQADDTLSVIAGNDITLEKNLVKAGNEIILSALRGITVDSGELEAKSVSLLTRQGDISLVSDPVVRYLDIDWKHRRGQIYASEGLDIHAGGNVTISDQHPIMSRNIDIHATGNVVTQFTDDVFNSDNIAGMNSDDTQSEWFKQGIDSVNKISADDSLTITAGGSIKLPRARLSSGQNVSLIAGQDIDLEMLGYDEKYKRYFDPYDVKQYSQDDLKAISPILSARSDILISAGRDISLESGDVRSQKNVIVLAGRDMSLDTTGYTVEKHQGNTSWYGEDKIYREKTWIDEQLLPTQISARNITLTAQGRADLYASDLNAEETISISAHGPLSLHAIKTDHYHHWKWGENKQESTHQIESKLNAGKDIFLITDGNLLFQGSRLTSGQHIQGAAKGGFLFAQAMEETAQSQEKSSQRKWYGKKKTTTHTRSEVNHKVVEFIADKDIELLSRDDSTYQASRISAGENANLTSQNGRVIFEAVKDSQFEQRITQSKGFYIKHADQGYQQDVWRLPVVNVGGKLTVDAAQGITAAIKQEQGQTLDQALDLLSATPGTEWLEALKNEENVQWNVVQDAYASWNHQQKSLNPAVAAVIAIAVAAVTAGYGLAAGAGNALAAGATGTTQAVLYGAGASGMTALASQAAVALVENQGNLSKTLDTLGKSEAVKSIAASMLVGGAMAGFDQRLLNQSPTPSSTRLPVLNDGDWHKVAQRVAGQSLIGAGVEQTLYGGSFKEQLTTALMGNIGVQVHAQGAKLIGDNGEILGSGGKALSHAVLAGLSAEIGNGSAKGAVAGALAAELMAISMGENAVKAEEWDRKAHQQEQIARAFGGVAGAVFTGDAKGAYSGANSSESVLRYNYLSHHQQELMEKELDEASGLVQKALIQARWGLLSQSQDGAFAAGVITAVPESLLELAQGIIGSVSNAGDIWASLKQLYSEEGILGSASVIGSSELSRIKENIQTMEARYERAGLDGAYASGVEAGKLIIETAALASIVGGIERVGTGIAGRAPKISVGYSSVADTPAKLMDELSKGGVKHTPESIVDIARTNSNRIVFLEAGKGGEGGSGLAHIIERHASQFADKGIPVNDIPYVIMAAIKEDKIVGKNGTAPVYEIVYMGEKKYIAIGVGDNGYIVRANPTSTWKE
ncbi:two-partner secretion domain-containing protein [Halotalea alkalilenta]|uniref:Filamentous haemagglutinin FhaB/tRNA nuclease CdiA-like TPS domain-containing protein n=1 Tax=Halotalea alkalilenta TaxID=376489 RepID=A0A172YBR5_9GAMM|nr:DUF637 domain-containing protein [Halotalea alkalilenta]ANF56445.1 hypothetical protein A5892_02330 [Halotalea alkalilenta]